MPTWLLAVLIAYLHFLYSHGREEEEPGEDNILSTKEVSSKFWIKNDYNEIHKRRPQRICRV